jgi:hypothetical protein
MYAYPNLFGTKGLVVVVGGGGVVFVVYVWHHTCALPTPHEIRI